MEDKKKAMKTDYSGHDKSYLKKKASGFPGWGSKETLTENLSRLEKTFPFDSLPKNGKILEMGCGAGDLSLALLEKNYQVWGVDISPFAVQWAKEKAKERNLSSAFQVGSVLDLKDYSSEFFDLVLDGYCLHCIIGEDRAKFLSSALRVLKAGGIFHSLTMCGEVRSPSLQEKYRIENGILFYGDIATRYVGSHQAILKEMEEAGFIIERWQIEPASSLEDMDLLLSYAGKKKVNAYQKI